MKLKSFILEFEYKLRLQQLQITKKESTFYLVHTVKDYIFGEFVLGEQKEKSIKTKLICNLKYMICNKYSKIKE